MRYDDIVIDQIDRIRQVRNDNPVNYPRAVETLWILLRNQETKGLIEQKKKELGIPSSSLLGYPDLIQWDTIFQYTLVLIPEYEGILL